MTRENLKRILSKRGEGASIVRAFVGAAGSPAVVRDMDGRLLLGAPGTDSDESPERHPVQYEGETVGWVSGGERDAGRQEPQCPQEARSSDDAESCPSTQ